MSPGSVKLGSAMLKVRSVDPARHFDEPDFTYIDISAVDQDTKQVSGAKTITTAGAPSRARQLLKARDILVSTVRPNLNAVAVVPDHLEESIGSTGFCILRPDPSKAHSPYLFHWVKSKTFIDDMVRKATGASYPAVSDRIIFDSVVPLPPLGEQRRIAATLDKAEELRSKRRAALALLDQLSQAIFFEMFGDPATNRRAWPIVRIGDLLESANYGTSQKAGSIGEWPILRMNNITAQGQLDLQNMKFIDLSISDVPKYTVKQGDILFNRTNSPELVGKTALYAHETPAAFAGYLVRLRAATDRAAPSYLAAFMNLGYTKRVLRSMAKSIVGMANINAKEVQSILIASPPLSLQLSFASRVEAVQIAKTAHRSALTELDNLFAALQDRAFGKRL